MRLDYVPFVQYSAGLIAQLLRSSYAPLIEELPNHKAEELLRAWNEYDAAVFAEPDTVGACGFCSRLGNEIVGMGSWDPRNWPVGHQDMGVGHALRHLR